MQKQATRRPFVTRDGALLAANVLVFGSIAGWAVFGAKIFGSDGHVTTLHGSVILQGADTFDVQAAAGSPKTCTGAADYNDITPGATIAIGNTSGVAAGIAQLGPGTPIGGSCAFAFSINVPTSTLYTVTLSHHGAQAFTPEQAALGLNITLGS